jgi:hypothetical protein
MRDIELYTAVLGIALPWRISDASLDVAQQEVEVSVTHDGSGKLGTALACWRLRAIMFYEK